MILIDSTMAGGPSSRATGSQTAAGDAIDRGGPINAINKPISGANNKRARWFAIPLLA
ncbi:MAG TPA: hypothetical protein VH374_23655 [Polyangia bacterium]|nr:hypothetical protein [Polyangia bacterium]